MTSRFRQLLTEIDFPAPPEGLFEATMERIAWERKAASIRQRLAFFGALAVALLAALAWVFLAIRSAMIGSGHLQFLTLAVSDTRAVLANGGAYVSSLLESLPAGWLAAFLGLTLCFMLVVRALIRDGRKIFGTHHRRQAFTF